MFCSSAVPVALLLVVLGALGEAPPASPLLPPDHWAVKAAERLEQLGLVERWMPAQRAVPLLAVEGALAEGERRAAERRPDLVPLLAAWRERFAQEWPRAGDDPVGPRLLGVQAGVGYQHGSARAASSARPPAGASAVRLQVPRSDPFAEAAGAAAYGSHLAAGLSLRGTPHDFVLPSVEVVGALGPVALSVGRGPVGYGPNEVGAVVASGAAALDRVEFMTTRAVRFPGPLAILGDWAVDLTLTRFEGGRHPYDPLLWLAQVQWRPHPRLTLAAIRGVMFGGKLWEGIPAGRAPLAILGLKNYRENNVYSGAVRYRLPTESVLPLTAKLEWGTDDNPGAAVQWPGLVVGLSAPMLPGLPAALGFEYAYFGRGPVGYHDPFHWYAHGQYNGGWVSGQTPIGDPMGGNGRAYRLTASVDPLPRLRLAATGWLQERFLDNLYAPAAGGRSVGFQGEAELRVWKGAVVVRGLYEHGRDGWNRGEVIAAARAFF